MSTLQAPAAAVALPALADYLARKQDAILTDWRSRVEADAESSALARLSRAEFCDHIPQFLDRLCGALRGTDPTVTGRFARYHGAQRWQHGISLESVTREWGLLHEVLMCHIAEAPRQMVGLDRSSLNAVYRMLAEQINHGIEFSLSEFDKRQRLKAETQLCELETVCAEHDENDKQRGRNLHEASHDLRGGLQVVQTMCELLKRRALDPETQDIVKRLCAATGNVNHLVHDLLDLARLEAGREERRIGAFDAAALLHQLCDTLRPAAEAEGLTLLTQGEASLPVRGDALKIRRIAQNLILNALKYTPAGAVEVGWAPESEQRWLFYVRDSGPGLPPATARNLAQSLNDTATLDSGETDAEFHQREVARFADDRAIGDVHDQSAMERRGEGIGLAIVRQLCELLDAVVELESQPGRGAMFRILVPTDYPDRDKKERRLGSLFRWGG